MTAKKIKAQLNCVQDMVENPIFRDEISVHSYFMFKGNIFFITCAGKVLFDEVKAQGFTPEQLDLIAKTARRIRDAAKD